LLSFSAALVAEEAFWQRKLLNSIKIGGSEVWDRPAQEGVLMHVMLRVYPNLVSRGYLLI